MYGDPSAPRRRIGEILLARGEVDHAALAASLRRQAAQGPGRARLGEILTAHGHAEEGAVALAVAEQLGLPFVDLERDPPDPADFPPHLLDAALRFRAVPWRDADGTLLLVAADPDALPARMGPLRRAFRLPKGAEPGIAATSRAGFDRFLQIAHPERRALRARRRTPRALSAEALTAPAARAMVGAGLAGAAAALLLAPGVALPALFGAALLFNLVNLCLRIAVCASALGGAPRPPACALRDPDRALPRSAAAAATLPRISLLIPLYREPGMVAPLVQALAKLEHPPEKLEAVFALEPEDGETLAALDAVPLPPWLKVVITPEGGPKTKPRALNHALDFCTGEIVGIYDAEDRPEPDQLRKVAEAFAQGSGRLACVQARLAFHNLQDGWIARSFAVEYVTWFTLVLPGMVRMGFPIPLGGTSVFFRRWALERIGAWDAHNVTEDADLGIRLARAGYVTGLVDSETREAATKRPLAWIRQRSRWQKGYLMTWLAHMRRPVRLARDLGLRGFLGFQAHFLGSAAAFLGLPLFWTVWLWWLFVGAPWEADWFQGAFGAVLFGALALGQIAAVGSAALAVKLSGRKGLMRAVLGLPLYFPLGSVSAVKATLEAALAPAFWDKTDHGEEG
ncbi:glycosyltransferase [Rhodovulum sp. DZ06]|uniref:glycosyltransferase n=1 Tax=Rhodovulum sp. DZ06 TaxID=3425126 RepID=UPI003D334F66